MKNCGVTVALWKKCEDEQFEVDVPREHAIMFGVCGGGADVPNELDSRASGIPAGSTYLHIFTNTSYKYFTVAI